MSSPIFNWAAQINTTEKETISHALKKARKMESEREKRGWRWIKVSNITKFFVPCDKRGHPTQEGEEMIAAMKVHLGLK